MASSSKQPETGQAQRIKLPKALATDSNDRPSSQSTKTKPDYEDSDDEEPVRPSLETTEQEAFVSRGALPTRSNFIGIGLGMFNGINITNYLVRFKEARLLLRIPDRLALYALKGLTATPELSQQISLFTATTKT